MNYQVFVTVKGEEREEAYPLSLCPKKGGILEAPTLADAQKAAQENLDYLKEAFPEIFINHEISTVVEA